jgi:transcriptional regulator GlxA family with amidase domain
MFAFIGRTPKTLSDSLRGPMPTLYFIVFDQVEVLDFSGPFDVFSMAKIATASQPYDLKLVSADGGMVTAIHGLKVQPDLALEQVTPGSADMVILPGGTTDVIRGIGGARFPAPPTAGDPSSLSEAQLRSLHAQCAAIVTWLDTKGRSAGLICTICVGAFFAAAAGLLAGRTATTHHMFLDLLEDWVGHSSDFPPDAQARIHHGARYVSNTRGAPLVMCSAGVSAGLDLSFALLARVLGPEACAQTKALMEYDGSANFAADLPVLPKPLRYGLTPQS